MSTAGISHEAECRDQVVRDLLDAIAIVHGLRADLWFHPSTTAYSILSSAKSHLENRLRAYLTGPGLGDGRTWQDRRR